MFECRALVGFPSACGLLGAMLLAGCVSVPERRAVCSEGPPVAPIASWNTQAQGVESIRFEREQTEVQLLFAWSQQPTLFALRGLNALGIEVFRLDADAQGTRWTTLAAAPLPMEAGRLLADFQLVHWPLEVLQQSYQNTPWSLRERDGQRRLSCFGVEVASVSPQEKPHAGFILSNIPGGYRLHGQALGGQ